VVGVVGPFPRTPRKLKFLIVGMDYFTKWIKAEAITKIKADKLRCFYKKNIICKFGMSKYRE